MVKINKLTFQQAKFLIERTGLGPELGIIQSFTGKSLDSSLREILSTPKSNSIARPKLLTPSVMQNTKKELRKSGKRKEANQLYRKERKLLMEWGLQNLLESNNALHERMVWFWHNHFTSSIKSVQIADWMLQQDLSIRNNALGSFSELLKTMTFDPAMLIYLDGKSNKKGQPNENFARELLELFTLGEGHYTENDIKEAARAFTGWGVSAKKGRAVFRKKRHDKGVKTFMGKQGRFGGEDILQILLQNPRTAEFICEKLWYEFVSIQKPEATLIKTWAQRFYQSNYDISDLLKTILTSKAFWDEKYRGTLIKSPIDLVVGTLRTFDLEDGNISLLQINKTLQRLEQTLYEPPNVKGWVGGSEWINDVSLPARQRFLQRVLRGQAGVNNKKKKKRNGKSSKGADNNMQGMMATKKMSDSHKMTLPSLPGLPERQWAQWLLPVPAVTTIKAKNKRQRLKALMLDPAYQLK